MFPLSITAREAIKAALAMVIVHAIAMSMGWTKPYWAGLAVMVMCLPTAGHSLNKGAERLVGTVAGCALALLFAAWFPQERWLYVLVISLYVGFATYKMTSSRYAYFWNMTALVCLIVSGPGFASSAVLFETAWTRTIQTGMGVVVYTLVAVFLWPRSNRGRLVSLTRQLIDTHAELYRDLRVQPSAAGTAERIDTAQWKQLELLAQLRDARQAAAAESYEVRRQEARWADLVDQSSSLMTALDRWKAGSGELHEIDLARAFPDLAALDDEVAWRFDQIDRMLGGRSPDRVPRVVSITVEPEQLERLGHFDRAAVLAARRELGRVEAATRELFETVRGLAGVSMPGGAPRRPPAVRTRPPFGIFDIDGLRGALMVMGSTWVAFLIWVYVNPPGHAGWLQTVPIFAFIVAMTPQFRMTGLIKLMGVAFPAAMLVYALVLPRLSGFVELGALIFIYIFLVCYLLKGLVRTFGMAGFLIMCPIENHQAYNFVALLNSLIFIELAVGTVFVASYALGSPRPDKHALYLLSRFFRRCEQLIRQHVDPQGEPRGRLGRWRYANRRHDLMTLPGKLRTWSSTLTTGAPDSVARVRELVDTVQGLAYRMRELLDTPRPPELDARSRELIESLGSWRRGVEQCFESWSTTPETVPAENLSARLSEGLARLEEQLSSALDREDERAHEPRDAARFYAMLGSYRSLSESLAAYANAARQVGIAGWREERF